jgi:hypothetical protein
MLLVCNTGFDDRAQQVFLKQLPIAFSNYYNILGPDRIKALAYRSENIKEEYRRLVSNQFVDIKGKILEAFKVGCRYPKSFIKARLKELYEESNYYKTAKATDLQDYFEIKRCKLYDDADKTKEISGFLIVRVL